MQHISLTINVASALVAAATTPNVAVAVAVAATCIYFLVDSVTPLPEQLRPARSTTNTHSDRQTDGLTD